MDKKVITKNSLETQNLGSSFATSLKPGDVVLLFGDLGAGKTTFVQGIAKGLKIRDRILSPTFVLQRSHKIKSGKIKNLNHIDLYRIDGKQALESLGLTEVINELDSITIIEWAERLLNFSPTNGYKVVLEHLDSDKRNVTISKI